MLVYTGLFCVCLILLALIWSLRSRLRGLTNHTDWILKTLGERLELLEKSTGGFWTTEDKRLLQIRQMSTGHIRACLNGPCGGKRAALEAEMARREIDRSYREKEEHRERILSIARADRLRRGRPFRDEERI